MPFMSICVHSRQVVGNTVIEGFTWNSTDVVLPDQLLSSVMSIVCMPAGEAGIVSSYVIFPSIVTGISVATRTLSQ